MTPFSYVRPRTEAEAFEALRDPDAVVIAGGTTLVDLMRLDVVRPLKVVDVTALPLARINPGATSVSIGALASNTDVAYHPAIVTHFPALSQALLSGASPQLRNMATIGGNLLQRTRCAYFRDRDSACNKRQPGAGCSAIGGYTRSLAVIGTSASCIAAHPSDMCVALVALDAIVHTHGVRGARAIPIADFHTLPGTTPHIETALVPGELVTHVDLPMQKLAEHSLYLKVRDRQSFAFALAAAAVALDLDGDAIRDARVVLGGVATKPWREHEVEKQLVGTHISRANFESAAGAALRGAAPHPDNAFKVDLAQRTIFRALAQLGGLS